MVIFKLSETMCPSMQYHIPEIGFQLLEKVTHLINELTLSCVR